jgi:branched-chain amino acid transport system substrate-binding protein
MKTPGSYFRKFCAGAIFFISVIGVSNVSQAADPIKFGIGAQLTGGLASNGKAVILAMQIWAEEVNANGGLLGRPVQLVYYDDQSNPGMVPGIYTKLLTVDKVDFLVGMSTNQIAPAMPIIIQKKKLIMGMFAIGLNNQFNYSKYFGIQPFGPNGADAMTHGFFDIAAQLEPKPNTIAMIGADAEFAKTILEGARASAKAKGFKIVYDQVYPPNSVDLTPILRAVQAAKPDLVLVASYPPDSVGVIHSAKEIGLAARMFGGALVGIQYASIKKQLGEHLNGVIGYDMYTPEPSMQFKGTSAFLEKYQARAAIEGTDALGFYGPLYAYAAMQVLAQAITQTGSVDQDVVSKQIHTDTFSTIVGDIKFGSDGEWATPRIITVQYQNLKGDDLSQFKESGHAVVLYPPEFKSGSVQTPYVPR